MDAPVWDVTVFAKNRERLLSGEIAAKFIAAVLGQRRIKTLLSDEHLSVDDTVIEAWVSLTSFQPKDGSGEPPGPGRNGERNFHGEKRSIKTHGSISDPEARLARKGDSQGSRMAYAGHFLMENRNGLVVGARRTQASGTAEREAALAMIDRRGPRGRRITLGADKGYDAANFIAALHAWRVTPHVAIDGHIRKSGKPRRTAIDRRTLRHPGCRISQLIRKSIEEPFRWIKTVPYLRKSRHRGIDYVGWFFTIAAVAYNLICLLKLLPEVEAALDIEIATAASSRPR